MALHIGRRQQANGMPKSLEFARPLMRQSAGLDTDQAPRQLLEEGEYVASFELTADDHIALRIDTVNLEYRLGNVETDCLDRG
jgi:hypothetical protein